MITAIFWKEFRQQSLLWAALFLFIILLQISALLIDAITDLDRFNFLGIAIVISGLYSASSAAILFCNEHEEKTFTFLRTLPVPRGSLLLGKLGWLLLGSTVFWALSMLESLAMNLVFPSFYVEWGYENWSEHLFEVGAIYFGCVIFPACWGFFWSIWTKNQLTALLGTFICASTSSFFIFLGYGVFTKSNYLNEFRDHDQFWIMLLFLLCTLLVGILGLFFGYFWFDLWKDRKRTFSLSEDSTPESGTARRVWEDETAREDYAGKPREFAALYMHTIRQSWNLFRFTMIVGVLFLIALLTYLTDFSLFSQTKHFDGLEFYTSYHHLSWLILWITTVVFCGSIFSADQPSRAAFLAQRGISPRKIWWSRVLAFGSVYFAILIFSSLILFCTYGVSGFGLGLINLGWSISLFFVGIVVSLFVRSRIVSIVSTAVINTLLMSWCTLMILYLGPFYKGWLYSGVLHPLMLNHLQGENPGYWIWFLFFFSGVLCSTLLWSVLPILLGGLAASRIRAADWLRERPILRSRRPVLTLLIAPFVLILFAIPLYRIYSVPKVDYGYRVESTVLAPSFQYASGAKSHLLLEERGFYGDLGPYGYIRNCMDLQTLKTRIQTIQEAFRDPARGDIAYHFLHLEEEVLRWIESDTFQYEMKYFEKEREKKEALAEGEEIPASYTSYLEGLEKKLTENLEILEDLGKNRIPFQERVQRLYEEDYRIVKYGLQKPDPGREKHGEGRLRYILRCIRWMPWEKQRVLRTLDYEFQRQSYIYDKAEKALFQGGERIPEFDPALLRWDRDRESGWRNPLTDELHTLNGESYMFRSMDHLTYADRLYTVELFRRALVLQLALKKYHLQNHRLPETLEELKTAEILQEIPQVPYYDIPFFYDPQPDGSEPAWELDIRAYSSIALEYFSKHAKGTPYLWAPRGLYDRSFTERFRRPYGTDETGRKFWDQGLQGLCWNLVSLFPRNGEH